MTFFKLISYPNFEARHLRFHTFLSFSFCASRILFVSALVFLSSSASSLCSRTIVSSFRFALFLLHQWFIIFFVSLICLFFLHWRRFLWCFIFSFVSSLVLPLIFYEPLLSSLCHCKFVLSSLIYLFSCIVEGHHCSIACCLGFCYVVFVPLLLLSSLLLP